MKKIYHIDRDHSLSLSEQKRKLSRTYEGFYYLFSDGKQIHFVAEGGIA